MRADRLLTIMLLLQTQGKMTTQTLAETLEVSRRTVLRDIDALTVTGVPIYTESGHGGGVYLDEKYRVSLTGLKEAEIRALFISSVPGPLTDIGLAKATESSLLKLFAALPARQQADIEIMRQRVHLDPTGWWHAAKPQPFLAELFAAVHNDYVIQVLYEDAEGQVNERILEPYSLVAKATVWYLVAARRGELRTYRLSRLHEVQVQGIVFQRDSEFDLAAYWAENSRSFLASMPDYKFTLQIRDEALQLLKWLVPEQFEVINIENEEGWFTAQVSVEHSNSAEMLVFGMGVNARVVEPPELLETVLSTARQIGQFYTAR